MIQRTKGRMRLCITLLILNIVFIWGNSLLPGELSGALSRWVKELLEGVLGQKPGGEGGHGLLRKVAHFTEFGCLGALLSWLLRMLRQRRWEYLLMPLCGGFLVACADEAIQCFVPDRGPGIRDVGIDTAGVLAGIILFSGVYFFRKKEKLSSKEW